jgi:hypothetical protein
MANKITKKQLKNFIEFLPQYLTTIATNVPEFEQRMLAARALKAPQELALDESLLAHFAPRFADVGADIRDVEAKRTAQTEADVLAGPGAELISRAQRLQQLVDPEFFVGRREAGQKYSDLLQTLDPSGLSGSEAAEVERNVNRLFEGRGLGSTPTSTSAIEAALQFGSRHSAKQSQIANILSQAPALLQASKSGVDVLQQATGRPSFGINPGLGAFNPSAGAGTGAGALGLSQGLFGEVGQNQRLSSQLSAAEKDWADYLSQVTGSVGNLSGAGAGLAGICWVAREVFDGDEDKVCKFRHWLLFKGPRWFYKLYVKFGERFAEWLCGKRTLKFVIRYWMSGRIS